MKTLIVEDDFVSRKILSKFLQKHGPCDIAIDGEEAIYAVDSAYMDDEPYDLICLDLLMPKIDGQRVLQEIRKKEASLRIPESRGIKIIMTTSVADPKQVMKAYRNLCDAYLVKPIITESLQEKLVELNMLVVHA